MRNKTSGFSAIFLFMFFMSYVLGPSLLPWMDMYSNLEILFWNLACFFSLPLLVAEELDYILGLILILQRLHSYKIIKSSRVLECTF